MISAVRDMLRPSDEPRKYLYAIIGLSVVLRIASALMQGDVVEPLPGVHDQLSYDLLARRVLSGYGFSFGVDWWPATKAGEPTAHWSYLYTLFLSCTYKLFGPHPVAARMLQALASGVLLPWLTWRLGNRVVGPTESLIAALIASVYGYYVFYAGSLMTEAFYVVAVLWTLDAAMRIRVAESPGTLLWIKFGLAIGVAVLLRQVFLLMTPLLVGWLLLIRIPNRHDPVLMGKTIKGILTVVVVVSAMIVPWTIRNYSAFGQFCLLNTSAGYAFYWGNHPIHGTHFIPILPSDGPSYGDLLPQDLNTLNEVALERELLIRGLSTVRQDPRRFFLLSLSRTVEYFKFWPTSESGFASNLVRTLSFGTLLPFALLGLWLTSRGTGALQRSSRLEVDSPENDNRWDFALLVLFAAGYTLIHLLSWTLIRYRLPIDAVLMIPASVGVSTLHNRCSAAYHVIKRGAEAEAALSEGGTGERTHRTFGDC